MTETYGIKQFACPVVKLTLHCLEYIIITLNLLSEKWRTLFLMWL